MRWHRSRRGHRVSQISLRRCGHTARLSRLLPTLRRRGVARTRPWALRVAGAGCERPSIAPAAAAAPTDEPPAKAPPIVLELEDGVWAGVPCWTGRAERWARWVVPIAYDLYYDTEVRPLMGGNQIGRKTLIAVAVARAQFADFNTGRNSRPTNKTLAPLAGCKERTVQRADKALRLLGVATEVLRGRQRTRAERLASWRVGDRARGWASVWALHDRHTLTSAVRVLSPHPEGSLFMTLTLVHLYSLQAAAALRASVDAAQGAAGARTARARRWRGHGGQTRTPHHGPDDTVPRLGRTAGRPSTPPMVCPRHQPTHHRLGRHPRLDPRHPSYRDRTTRGDAQMARRPRGSPSSPRHGTRGRRARRRPSPGQ